MMKGIFQPFLEKQRFILLDGALATELEKKGADLNHPLWSAKILLEKPELIRQVHLEYLEAGADIITTSSYQASFEGFDQVGVGEEDAKKLFKRSVQLAEEARVIFLKNNSIHPKPLIAASLGPYGAFLSDGSEYHGEYGVHYSALKNFHERRLRLFEQSSADFLLFETIPSLEETKVILEILLDSNSQMPAIISFSCRDDLHINDGTQFSKIVEEVLKRERVVSAGVNCTSPRFISPLFSSIKTNPAKLLLAYPNSGEKWDSGSKSWHPSNCEPNSFEKLEEWLRLGVKIVGGCCRTTPAQINDLAQLKMKS